MAAYSHSRNAHCSEFAWAICILDFKAFFMVIMDCEWAVPTLGSPHIIRGGVWVSHSGIWAGPPSFYHRLCELWVGLPVSWGPRLKFW